MGEIAFYMKNFLSIGEVGKIEGVSAKSLRYYERLGILVPAYINPETGYRYYTVDQLLIVDLITICVETGIPLKNLQKYITDQQTINIQHLLVEGEEMIDQKIDKLKKAKQFLENLSTNVLRTNRVKSLGAPFIEEMPERYFLTIDSYEILIVIESFDLTINPMERSIEIQESII